MKILHISSVKIDYPGGTEKIIMEISKRQSKNNEVVILQTNLYEEDKIFKKIQYKDGIKIITVKNDLFLGGFGYSREFKKILKSIWKDFDIVHIHGHGRYTSNFALKFLKKKKPIIYSAQGFFHNKKYSFFKKMYDYLFGGRLKNASYCTALTELEIEKLESYGVKRENIIVIPGGVDYERISSYKNINKLKKKYLGKRKEKILLYVGRIHKSKGIQHVISAIEDVDILFFIVGKDAGYEEYLKNLVKSKNLEKKVRFFGASSEEALIELYQVADILVLYSDHEGFGIVLIEAMAAGNPCIVSNKGSLPYLIKNNYNGFVVNNIEELRNKIDKLSRDNSLRRNLSENSKQFAKNFSWNEISKKHEGVYLKAIREDKKANDNL